MDKKVIEGETYVPQAEIEAAFKERIKKLSADRVAAEDRAKQLQGELDNLSGKLGTIDTMAGQLEEYKTKLTEAETRYSRHTAMADQGWTDPDLRDAVEWSYNKAMKNKSKKDQMSLSDWLLEIKNNPDTAPSILRPHLNSEAVPQQIESVEAEAPALIPPKTNTGIKPTPIQSTDLVEKGATDLEFYRANRDAIRKAYLGR